MFSCPKCKKCSKADSDTIILENTLPPVKQTEKPAAYSDTPSAQTLPGSFFNENEGMSKQEIDKRTREVRRRSREGVIKRDQATVVSEHFIKTVKMQRKSAGASGSKKATPVAQDTTGGYCMPGVSLRVDSVRIP